MSMNESLLRFKVLGTRGSMAIARKDQMIFGGNTSCYMVRAGEETVFFDAGSGLLNAPADFPRPPHILLSHLHLDHLMGLGMYPRLSQSGKETYIHVPANPGENPSSLLGGIFSPPYWPVSLDVYKGRVQVLPLSLPIKIGDLVIDGIPGNHPGGSYIYRLRWQGRSIIYASDYEYDEPSFRSLIDLARGADLLLFDGQYLPEELASHRGFGHSTPQQGIELLERCGCARLWLIHHSPQKSDEQLLAIEKEFARKHVHFAREGEEILL